MWTTTPGSRFWVSVLMMWFDCLCGQYVVLETGCMTGTCVIFSGRLCDQYTTNGRDALGNTAEYLQRALNADASTCLICIGTVKRADPVSGTLTVVPCTDVTLEGNFALMSLHGTPLGFNIVSFSLQLDYNYNLTCITVEVSLEVLTRKRSSCSW